MTDKSEKASDVEGEDKKEIKVTLFGVLSATKALLNLIDKIFEVVVQTQEIERQRLESDKQSLATQKRIEEILEVISASQKAIADNLLRTANAVENLKIQ